MRGFVGFTKRNMMLYFKDLMAVIFSMLTSIIVFALYQSLLLKKDLEESFIDNFENDTNDYYISVKDDLINNLDSYILDIEPLLVKWTFDRLSYIDQAILLESLSEIRSGINNKNIVIDEAVRIAKEYSDPESYKYINGVLDKLWALLFQHLLNT